MAEYGDLLKSMDTKGSMDPLRAPWKTAHQLQRRLVDPSLEVALATVQTKSTRESTTSRC